MAENVELTGIEFQIVNDSKSAVDGLDKLKDALKDLKSATSGGVSGVSAAARQVTRLKEALNGIDSGTSKKIKEVVGAVSEFKKLKDVKISSTINNNLKKIAGTVHEISREDIEKLNSISGVLHSLSGLERPRIGTYLNQLKKIPEVVAELDKVDIKKFTDQMKELSAALKPFADEMYRVHQGFNAFPSRIQRLIRSTEQYNGTMKKAKEATTGFGSSLKMLNFSLAVHWLERAGHFLGGMIDKASSYRETLNMFEVAMGEYAESEFKYAKLVSESMGIDIADWMKSQATLQTLLTGFGNTAERAAFMSRNLTQLGYDLSSFTDIPEQEAMIKVQSGIAGELEPLRGKGYDLSVAKLQEIATGLGVEKLVSQMNQAEKAELRYYAIMTQVSTSHTDMARTIMEPANQLRVLRAQVNMAARSIGNLFIPALNAILPVAIAVVQIIRDIADAIAKLFNKELPEVDFNKGKGLGNPIANAAEQADKLGNALGNAAEKAKKLKQYTAGFDELNVFAPQADVSSAGGVGGIGAGGYGGSGLGIKLPGYDDFVSTAVKDRVDTIKNTIKTALTGITLMLGGFSLAIGAVLAFTGADIPKGIGLMVLGAAAIGTTVALRWDALDGDIRGQLAVIVATVSASLLALGAVLAFSGANVPLGIGLMAMGATGIATAAGINWGFMEMNVSKVLQTLLRALSKAEVAVGGILALSGVNVPLGLSLIAAGIVTAVTAETLNWNSTTEPVKKTITQITLVVSSALLALGAILAFSGGNIPLGIGLMAAGAVGVASAIALNWGTVKEKISSTVRNIEKVISGAMLVVGVLLCLSGAGVGLGLAVIHGAVKLSTRAWQVDDNPIIRFVKNMANGIIGVINHVIDAVNSIFSIDYDGLDIMGKRIIDPIHVELVHLNHIPLYADGGFPDEGSLFVANEAGPEMVGRIGRRTAVANNEQIVESVSTGVSVANENVVAAIYQLLKVVEDKNLSVSIGDDEIGRSTERYEASRGAHVNSGAFSWAY